MIIVLSERRAHAPCVQHHQERRVPFLPAPEVNTTCQIVSLPSTAGFIRGRERKTTPLLKNKQRNNRSYWTLRVSNPKQKGNAVRQSSGWSLPQSTVFRFLTLG